jgi:ligand-binding SRPBCC domain-containing protein
MTTLKHEVRIAAPLTQVWDVLADLEAVQSYNPKVATARVISEQRNGVGASRRCELKPKGWMEERVWEWNPMHSIGLEISASDWPIRFMKWRTTLEENGDATIVRQSLDYQLKFGFFGAILNALVMRRMMDRNLREVFTCLQQHVEKTATT